MERQQQIVKVKAPWELDYNDLLRQAYYDCIVALNSPFNQAYSNEGMNLMQSTVAWDRFEGCVLILNAMIHDEDKDSTFKEKTEKLGEKDSLDLFHEITELFKRNNIYKVLGVPHAKIP